jgi:hypothetical protein
VIDTFLHAGIEVLFRAVNVYLAKPLLVAGLPLESGCRSSAAHRRERARRRIGGRIDATAIRHSIHRPAIVVGTIHVAIVQRRIIAASTIEIAGSSSVTTENNRRHDKTPQ